MIVVGEHLAQLRAKWNIQTDGCIVFLRVGVRHDAAKCKIWRRIQVTATVVNPKATGILCILLLYEVDLTGYYIILCSVDNGLTC